MSAFQVFWDAILQIKSNKKIPEYVRCKHRWIVRKFTLGIHATQVMSLTENIVVEIFVDHIETSSLERQRWLTRVRTAGFDQALMEFEELLMEPGNSWLVTKWDRIENAIAEPYAAQFGLN